MQILFKLNSILLQRQVRVTFILHTIFLSCFFLDNSWPNGRIILYIIVIEFRIKIFIFYFFNWYILLWVIKLDTEFFRRTRLLLSVHNYDFRRIFFSIFWKLIIFIIYWNIRSAQAIIFLYIFCALFIYFEF